MKIIKTITTAMMIFSVTSSSGQQTIDSLLKMVEENNPALAAARQMMEAEQMEAITGLAPDNPEVEFAYLWGSPEELGNRTDLAITQSVDFPTAYVSRAKLSKITRQQASLAYELRRQEIMTMARKAWTDRVWLNRVEMIISSRLEDARAMVRDFTRKLELGEINRLELNQVRMKVISLENELSKLDQKFSENDAEILTLTGGVGIIIEEREFPLTVELDFDSLIGHYRQGYANRYYLSEIERMEQKVDVAIDMKLPRLKAGYYRETILGAKLEGILAGITIPLWGNARAVKSAKARLAFAETDANRYWQRKRQDLESLYQQWLTLKERTEELEVLLSETNSNELLSLALENGEISVSEYYFESDYFFHNVLLLEEFRRDLHLLEAELLKVHY